MGILGNSVRSVRVGFKSVDLFWRWFNNVKEKGLVFLAEKIPRKIKPNHLSWARIGFAVVIFLMLFRYSELKIGIIVLLLLSSITDLIDGPLARSRHMTSEKGAFLDRVGDKLLICPLLAAMVWYYDKMLVAMIVGSEIISLSIAISAMKRQVSTKSNCFGQLKMGAQSIGLLIILFFPMLLPVATKVLWIALGLGIASLTGHFQTYIRRV